MRNHNNDNIDSAKKTAQICLLHLVTKLVQRPPRSAGMIEHTLEISLQRCVVFTWRKESGKVVRMGTDTRGSKVEGRSQQDNLLFISGGKKSDGGTSRRANNDWETIGGLRSKDRARRGQPFPWLWARARRRLHSSPHPCRRPAPTGGGGTDGASAADVSSVSVILVILSRESFFLQDVLNLWGSLIVTSL